MRKLPPSPRDPNGRFLKGHGGNPAGRPKATARPKRERSDLLPVKRNGRTRYEEAKPIIMMSLAAKAVRDNDKEAARLYLREKRLTENQSLKRELAGTAAKKVRSRLLYYEAPLLALGVLRVDRNGHLVIPAAVFADLDRLYSTKRFSGRTWRQLELALDRPEVIVRRYPNRRLKYKTADEAARGRELSLAEVFEAYDAMIEEVEEYQRFKRSRSKSR